jgi:hypothetical protein
MFVYYFRPNGANFIVNRPVSQFFANPIFLRHVRTISATTCLNSKELRRFPSYSRHHIQGHSCSIPPLGELAEASIFDGMSHLKNYDLYMGSWTNPPPLCVPTFPRLMENRMSCFRAPCGRFIFTSLKQSDA